MLPRNLSLVLVVATLLLTVDPCNGQIQPPDAFPFSPFMNHIVNTTNNCACREMCSCDFGTQTPLQIQQSQHIPAECSAPFEHVPDVGCVLIKRKRRPGGTAHNHCPSKLLFAPATDEAYRILGAHIAAQNFACVDSLPNCPKLVQHSQCGNSSSSTRLHCVKSCTHCLSDDEGCQDQLTRAVCVVVRDRGDCHTVYAKNHCRRTCSLCDVAGNTTWRFTVGIRRSTNQQTWRWNNGRTLPHAIGEGIWSRWGLNEDRNKCGAMYFDLDGSSRGELVDAPCPVRHGYVCMQPDMMAVH